MPRPTKFHLIVLAMQAGGSHDEIEFRITHNRHQKFVKVVDHGTQLYSLLDFRQRFRINAIGHQCRTDAVAGWAGVRRGGSEVGGGCTRTSLQTAPETPLEALV